VDVGHIGKFAKPFSNTVYKLASDRKRASEVAAYRSDVKFAKSWNADVDAGLGYSAPLL
jgi:hypothetical protein